MNRGPAWPTGGLSLWALIIATKPAMAAVEALRDQKLRVFQVCSLVQFDFAKIAETVQGTRRLLPLLAMVDSLEQLANTIRRRGFVLVFPQGRKVRLRYSML